MRPQLPHVVVWIVARFALELLFLFSALVGFDLFNNNILPGEKLQPAQAVLLRLDEGYVRDPIAEADAGEDSKVESPGWFESFDESDVEESEVEVETTRDPTEFMTPEQQRVVRNRLGALFALATVLIFLLFPTIDYYRTWILQRVNQYLRITMMERAEHLSLRYHSHARTGDAIYRIYQDSAMITSVIERVLLEPLVPIGQVAFSFVVIWLFSPILGDPYLAGMLPILWLVT